MILCLYCCTQWSRCVCVWYYNTNRWRFFSLFPPSNDPGVQSFQGFVCFCFLCQSFRLDLEQSCRWGGGSPWMAQSPGYCFKARKQNQYMQQLKAKCKCRQRVYDVQKRFCCKINCKNWQREREETAYCGYGESETRAHHGEVVSHWEKEEKYVSLFRWFTFYWLISGLLRW